MKINKILIVEDQRYPLEALELAVKETYPGVHYDIAKCYTHARQKIISNKYNIILLDHRMPEWDTANMEETNFDAFCDRLENIGFELIPIIREQDPKTIIIGTSSLDKSELQNTEKPDYTMCKNFCEASEHLAIIKSVI